MVRFLFEDDANVRPLDEVSDPALLDAIAPVRSFVEEALTELSCEELDVVFWEDETGVLKMTLRGPDDVVHLAKSLIPRPHASFDSRYDLGVELVDLLDGLDLAETQADADLWDWLSLCLIDQICPPDEARRRRPGQIDRYLLQLENHRTRYRHLVRTAWSLVRVHGSAVRFMLAGRLHVHGEAAEQLGAYQDVITCKPLIAAIGFLAWDADRASLKRGFGGSGPGSARRVPVVAKQFRLTYDLDSMRPEQVLALLPREFDRFKERISESKARRPSLETRWTPHEPRPEANQT